MQPSLTVKPIYDTTSPWGKVGDIFTRLTHTLNIQQSGILGYYKNRFQTFFMDGVDYGGLPIRPTIN